jgi:DNA-binding protein Alba
MIQQKELKETLSIEPQEQKTKIREYEIFMGGKPFMKYVRSAEILLRNKNLNLIIIRARGMNISKAVDLAESVKNKFCKDLNLSISEIKTSTENYMKDNREFSVSVIELTIKK